MPARPFAAAPSANDEPAMRKAPLRICIYALDESSATQLDALRVRLPANARLALLGAGATGATWPDAERVTDASDAQDLFAMLAAAAARFPGEDLVLVRADLDLPAFACERLLRALDAPDVLAALPLDGDRHPPIPPDLATDLAAGTLDALCYAYSDHALCDDAGAHTDAPPGLSAWHGARLARLGTDGLRERLSRRDILDAGGLRVVVLDHLYVGRAIRTPLAPERDPRDPSPPSPLAPLQQRIAAALGSVAKLSCPGLDAKPVILHVLHGWGGGAERWVRDFAAADSAAHHLVLIARGSFTRRCHGEWLELHDGSLSGPPLRRWPLPRAIADTALADSTCRELLADVLRTYCVDAVIVSSLIGHSLDALRTGLPTTCVVHDHYPLWPTLHRDFGDAALRFDDALRAADLAAQGDDREFANVDPAHWRRLRDGFVAAALEARATLIAPSRSALANQRRLAPELAALPSHVIAQEGNWHTHGVDDVRIEDNRLRGIQRPAARAGLAAPPTGHAAIEIHTFLAMPWAEGIGAVMLRGNAVEDSGVDPLRQRAGRRVDDTPGARLDCARLDARLR